MSEPKQQKKKSLTTLWADIKAIRQRKPTDTQIEELDALHISPLKEVEWRLE